MNIHSATREEMEKYAEEEYGVRFPSHYKDDTVRDKLLAMMGTPPVQKIAPGVKGKRYKINIAVSDKPGGDKPVFVMHNFRTYYIQRGIDVDVPEGVVNVLRDAIEDKYDPVVDPQTGRTIDMKKRRVPSYPFSVLGEVA